MYFEGVLLMQLVVDATGRPAPRLIDVHPTREAATELYRDLRSQAVRMLDADVIHGDLSPYNVLVGAAGPTIIDFPQIIAAAKNSRSAFFFTRDLENLRRHLASFDPGLARHAGDANEIWNAYTRRELTPEFVPSGRAPERQAAHHPPQHPPSHPPQRQPQRNPGHNAGGGRPPQRQTSGNPQRRGGPPPAAQASAKGRPPGPVVERVVRLPSGPAEAHRSSGPGTPPPKPPGAPGAPAHHRHRHRHRHRGGHKPTSP